MKQAPAYTKPVCSAKNSSASRKCSYQAPGCPCTLHPAEHCRVRTAPPCRALAPSRVSPHLVQHPLHILLSELQSLVRRCCCTHQAAGACRQWATLRQLRQAGRQPPKAGRLGRLLASSMPECATHAAAWRFATPGCWLLLPGRSGAAGPAPACCFVVGSLGPRGGHAGAAALRKRLRRPAWRRLRGAGLQRLRSGPPPERQ